MARRTCVAAVTHLPPASEGFDGKEDNALIRIRGRLARGGRRAAAFGAARADLAVAQAKCADGLADDHRQRDRDERQDDDVLNPQWHRVTSVYSTTRPTWYTIRQIT